MRHSATDLGDALDTTGDAGAARSAWQQALTILDHPTSRRRQPPRETPQATRLALQAVSDPAADILADWLTEKS